MKVTDIRVTPVAVADPPLLNSAGIHQPYALRTIIEVETDEGLVGLGETYGRAGLRDAIEAVKPHVVGLDPFDLNGLSRATFAITPSNAGIPLSHTPGTLPDRARSVLLAALEIPFLDLQGKETGRPVVDLLGGKVRERVPFAAYLFYKQPEHIGGEHPADRWGGALDPDGVVAQARRMVDEYGFESLKLKGGVFQPAEEVEAIRALRSAFPDHPARLDPNANWTIETSIAVAHELEGDLEYLEDPTEGLEGMAAVARETDIPLATNMAVVAFEHLPENARLDACQVILSDPHYYGGLQLTRHLATICDTWGLGLSMHSNSHLGISLAAMVHVAAAIPNMDYACDTHYPWQDEEVIVGGKLPITSGAVDVPEGPGLGVELDRDALAQLHEQYERCGIRERDDVSEMRKYDPSWTGERPRF